MIYHHPHIIENNKIDFNKAYQDYEAIESIHLGDNITEESLHKLEHEILYANNKVTHSWLFASETDFVVSLLFMKSITLLVKSNIQFYKQFRGIESKYLKAKSTLLELKNEFTINGASNQKEFKLKFKTLSSKLASRMQHIYIYGLTQLQQAAYINGFSNSLRNIELFAK